MENENDNENVQSMPNKNLSIKNQTELRIKLSKLANNYFKPRCDHFINNMNSLNFRILESSGRQKNIDQEVKESKNFRFGKNKDYFIHYTDLSPYKIEFSPFIKCLKDQFSKDEINIIKKNKDYYIQNQIIKNNISIFNHESLYQILNSEEKEEMEKHEQEKKNFFRNLNYFNEKRKKAILSLYDSNIKNNSDIYNNLNYSNKSINSYLPFYKTSLNNNNGESSKSIQKIKLGEILDYSSPYLIKKYKLESIEREIKKGIIERKKEDEKLNLNKENREKIFLELEKEYELKRQMNNKNYTKFNEMNLFKNKYKNIKKLKGGTFFPKINDSKIISKVSNPPSPRLNYNIIGSSDNIKTLKTIILRGKDKDKEDKNQISLYKKGNLTNKINDYNDKKVENEKILIKKIDRRIKSIYDSFKYQNKYN